MPGLDFTLGKYAELCQSALRASYKVDTVSSHLQRSNEKTTSSANNYSLILRHDVDRLVGKALAMARLEHSIQIKTTYYFRRSGFSHRDVIKAVAEMGHEIGYHYEVLDKANGNQELAIRYFQEELGELRQLARIETICMHGNPLTKWLNRDIWKHYDYREFGLLGEAYLSLGGLPYLSDTGRTWDPSRKAKDIPVSGPSEKSLEQERVVSTDDLIGLVNKRKLRTLYLTVHPERWSSNLMEWAIDEARDTSMNAVKYALKFIERRG